MLFNLKYFFIFTFLLCLYIPLSFYILLNFNYLLYLIFFILVILIILLFLSFLNISITIFKSLALILSGKVYILSLYLWIFFDYSTAQFQFIYTQIWWQKINIHLGLDGISLLFIILTTFLIFICFLASWRSITFFIKEYIIAFFFLELFVILAFSILDLILFYIFFESILIPMFFIIGIWGSRERKIHAAYQFFFYTLLGSSLMLLAILTLYSQIGTTNLTMLFLTEFSFQKQFILWFCFFISFIVKIPLVPVHIWLPEAHVEAPTSGSVILAGILLKLGTYGFLRFLIPLFPYASIYFTPFIYTISIITIIYTSLTALRQIDLKKIIAYSSIAHMGVISLGIFSFNLYGIEGSLISMLSHGFISSALFLCVGVLYDRCHTRLLKYYGGLVNIMPLFSFIFLFFILSNSSIPGTAGFIGEFLIFIGIFELNTIAAFGGNLIVILSISYSIWLFNRICFGYPSSYLKNYIHFKDINRREFALFFPLIICTLWMGIYPEVFLKTMHISVTQLLYIFFF